jgi:L-asparaginase
MNLAIELAKLSRSQLPESVHLGHICFRDNNSNSRSWGSEEFETFTRSCIKPIQAKISRDLLGGLLQDELLALACGSHLGEDIHISQARKFLNDFNISEVEVNCGIHSNSRGELNSCLYHNCSGKHLAIIAACKSQGWSTNDYLSIEHPYNQLVLNEIKSLTALDEIKTGYDDCGLPSFYMSLKNMTKLFYQMIVREDYQAILETMNRYPYLVAGHNHIDSVIMAKFPNRFIAKGGAEGLMMIANLRKQEVAVFKVLDGSNRAKAVIANRLMIEFGWVEEKFFPYKIIRDSHNREVGKITSDLSLNLF